MRNLYDVLEISPKASEEVIKSAYRTLAKKYHPDLGISILDEKMTELNYAYEILINPEKRREYDQANKIGFKHSNNSVNIFSSLNPKDYFNVIDLKCKLVPVDYKLINVGSNLIQSTIKVKNYYNIPIIALKGEIRCFDFFGNEYTFNGKPFIFSKQDVFINKFFQSAAGDEFTVIIEGNLNIKLIFFEIKEIVFESGDKWQQKDPLWVYPKNTINKDEFLKLRRIFSIYDAWKPFKNEQYWGCVCGKYNLISDTNCINCRRNMCDTVLTTEEINNKYNALIKEEAEEDKRSQQNHIGIIIAVIIVISVAVFATSIL